MNAEQTREIEELLNVIEPILLQRAGASGLGGTRVERWRWDEPDVTLTWTDHAGVGKSVHAVIDTEKSTVRLEVNAWRDKDFEDGKVRVRNWRHQTIGVANVPLDVNALGRLIDDAYDIARRWGADDLKESVTLRP